MTIRKTGQETPITRGTILRNAAAWLPIIKYGESGTVIQLQDDCEYRIPEVIENISLRKRFLGAYHRKYILRYFPVDEQPLMKLIHEELTDICTTYRIGTPGTLASLSPAELLQAIANKGYDVGLFLTHLSSSLTSPSIQPLIDLEQLVRTSKNLSVIVFSEVNISEKKYARLADKCSFLFDHLIHYPLYSPQDSLQFLSYYSNTWGISFPVPVYEDIIRRCGGYLWILHHVLRTLRDNQTWTVDQALQSPALLPKILAVWNKFSKQEQNLFIQVHRGLIRQEDTLSDAYIHLLASGFIAYQQEKPVLGMPILEYAIRSEAAMKRIITDDKTIRVNGADISRMFTPQERVFFNALCKSKQTILSREEVAQLIWGIQWEDHYSDWALDRLAFRLRKKLIQAGLPHLRLTAIKKKGFHLL